MSISRVGTKKALARIDMRSRNLQGDGKLRVEIEHMSRTNLRVVSCNSVEKCDLILLVIKVSHLSPMQIEHFFHK